MKVLIASDHAGFDLKQELIKQLPEIEWQDLGPANKDSVDYPDYADRIAKLVNNDATLRGVLICGSGQGMAMRANKYSSVRAALVWNKEVTALSRSHNDANILCLAARFTPVNDAKVFVQSFLETKFEGGRHSSRVAKVGAPVESC